MKTVTATAVRTRSTGLLFAALALAAFAPMAHAQDSNVNATNKYTWGENIGWMNWRDAGNPVTSQGAVIRSTFLSGFVWAENVGWINLGDGTPANGVSYANANSTDFGVNRDFTTGNLSGFGWGENIGWINFSGGALATPPIPARLDQVSNRFRGYIWGENVGWINLDDATKFVGILQGNCGSIDFDGDGDEGTDADIEAFFIVLAAGVCPTGTCGSIDFDGDGDEGTDADIEAFFRVIAAGPCQL